MGRPLARRVTCLESPRDSAEKIRIATEIVEMLQQLEVTSDEADVFVALLGRHRRRELNDEQLRAEIDALLEAAHVRFMAEFNEGRAEHG